MGAVTPSKPMPTAHLLFGYLGSGKTTLARALECQHDAVRFTPDEWMARLFGEDPPAEIFQEKAAAILSIMEPIWTRCLFRGVDVVLDYGFWRRSDRDRVRQLVREVGAVPQLWSLDCSDEEARERVALRNRAGHRSLYIAPATFDLLKHRLEPIEPDEDHTLYNAS